jgi:hypothetical protein
MGEDASLETRMSQMPWPKAGCGCFRPEQRGESSLEEVRRRRVAAGEVTFHSERQDTECDAWKTLLELIEDAAARGAKTFAPLRGLPLGQERKLVTLPPTIAKLKKVKAVDLYGSHLVRIPPEIGEMENLREFDPYTSRRLHWSPYEITWCRKLRRSRVSTRALYGNFKFRPPFPRLDESAVTGNDPPTRCSVCRGPIPPGGPQRVWISLRVATDVLPLLVHACSAECIRRLPRPADGYVPVPHRGGIDLEQPRL